MYFGKIEIQLKDKQRSLRTFNTLHEAAKHLDCSLTTIKKYCRGKKGPFYGVNKKTNATCFFSRANHKDKLVLEQHHKVHDSFPQFTNRTHAAKYLGVTPTAIFRKIPSPGIWWVQNTINGNSCFITYTKKKRK